jgi:exodeoxyribonuclease VII large subunit
MLLIQFEELKQKLHDEGLFDINHKKSLPKYPSKIGLITAPYGAAVQDMLKTIKHRWPLAEVYIYPSLVQGNDASLDIVKNISKADNDNLDVIICGRGGGSIEDLWPFNEEIVARAFYSCKTPIISAVGHEIDVVISDYVADARGLTPTDGAMKATPNLIDVLEKVRDLRNKLKVNIDNQIKFLNTKVNNLKSSYVLVNPTRIYENYRFKIDELQFSLISNIKEFIYQEKLNLVSKNDKIKNLFNNIYLDREKKLALYSYKLDGLSPLKVLKRGYAFATVDNKVVKSVDDVKVNENIKLSLSNGSVNALVISKEKK